MAWHGIVFYLQEDECGHGSDLVLLTHFSNVLGMDLKQGNKVGALAEIGLDDIAEILRHKLSSSLKQPVEISWPTFKNETKGWTLASSSITSFI